MQAVDRQGGPAAGDPHLVRPNRGTVFRRHLTREGVGPTLAADVVRARSASDDGVCVVEAVEPRAVACAWAAL